MAVTIESRVKCPVRALLILRRSSAVYLLREADKLSFLRCSFEKVLGISCIFEIHISKIQLIQAITG
jgi:hypothetical protein